MSVCESACLSVCLCVCLSVCLSVSMSVCLSVRPVIPIHILLLAHAPFVSHVPVNMRSGQ